jgi:predicted negative regulator of RcsB-dependent stress response
MLGLYAYARYAERPSWRRYLPLALAFACALASKAMVVTFPLVLLLLDVWPLARVRRVGVTRLVVEKLPLLAGAALLAALTFFAQVQAGAVSTVGEVPLEVRVAQALISSVAYIGKMLWPQGLAFFYPYPSVIPLGKVVFAALTLVILSAGAARAAGRCPYVAVGWCWYLVTLLPVIGLVQVGMQAMADRYTYLPLVGLFIAVCWGVPDLLAGRAWARRALVPLALATAAACVVQTRIQVGYWRNDIALNERALAVTTDNYVAHNNLALELADQYRFDEAREHFVEALRIQPGYSDARNNLAGVLLRQGRTQEAIAQLQTAVENAPTYAPAHRNLAAILLQAGRTEEAAAHQREALRLEAGEAGAR